MLRDHQNIVLADIKQTMTVSWHVVAKLHIVGRMSKLDPEIKCYKKKKKWNTSV